MHSQNPIGQPFVQLSTVESTNNYAIGRVQAQLAEHGATWFAHNQTAGKGQRGKSWNMEPGQNIILSTVIDAKRLKLTEAFLLSAVVALACHDFFSHYALHETTIKWPNDLYWRDRKAGGILIENILQGKKWKYAIVGIGININQSHFPNHLPNPVSLKQITGKTFDPIVLSQDLCQHLQNRWEQMINNEHEKVLSDYIRCMYKLNTTANFKTKNALITATVKGINKKGELLLQDSGGEQDTFTIPHGEWQWLIQSSLNKDNVL